MEWTIVALVSPNFSFKSRTVSMLASANIGQNINRTLFKFQCSVSGCIPADEMKFVLMHLPGKITYKEIDEMIHTVDKNGDGKISFSEFRVMMGGIPLLLPN